MTFEEWWEKEDFFASNGGTEKDVARLAFNAAIYSAIKVITDSSDSGESLYLIGEIKELK